MSDSPFDTLMDYAKYIVKVSNITRQFKHRVYAHPGGKNDVSGENRPCILLAILAVAAGNAVRLRWYE